MFEPINFEEFNETDVREEILAPLVRDLGYRRGTEHDVIREQPLHYPYAFLGRKDSKKDPILRGKADYILVAGGKVRWVIEAKAPQVSISAEEIQQAWTYANHAEVRAVYFALCNGRELCVFQTNRGPNVGPILSVTYEELSLADKYLIVKGLLSPDAILRDHPDYTIDLGPPLGPGLRSIARVTSGFIRYDRISLNLPAFTELQNTIVEGGIERDESGHLVAWVRTVGPTRSLQELNERLSLAAFEMTSLNSLLSTDPQEPTVFEYNNLITLPEGEECKDPNTWRTIKLPANISCRVMSAAAGVLHKREFSGKFSSQLHYTGWINLSVTLSGSFAVHLA